MAITQIDNLEFDTADGRHISLCVLSSTLIAMVYQGVNDDGYIKTFSVDGNQNNITEIDELEFDTAFCAYTSIVKIDATHFATAYADGGADGHVVTFSCDGNGDNVTEIDDLQYDTDGNLYTTIGLIDATHLVVANTGAGSDGYVRTFSFDGAYDNITEIDELEFDTAYGYRPKLIVTDSTHFAISYSGNTEDAFIKTFSVDGAADNITLIDTLEHDAVRGRYNWMIEIDATHFLVAYSDNGNDGFIKTFSVDGAYDNITQIDSLEHETVNTYDSRLTQLDATHYVLARKTGAGSGLYKLYLTTFTLDGGYNITEVESVLVANSPDAAIYTGLGTLDSNHIVVAYTDSSSDGIIETYSCGFAEEPGGETVDTIFFGCNF